MTANRHRPGYHKNRRRQLMSQGRCPECTLPRETPQFVLCANCRHKRRNWWLTRSESPSPCCP